MIVIVYSVHFGTTTANAAAAAAAPVYTEFQHPLWLVPW